ncbi:CHAT domain-containing protein [uncultured Aquimarina sp.]|uniref:CHAT domain-containing protein n=1 Tax=uncultured Aquimarina sp. TaxID=575652 RepID=UPI00261BA94D|nr:CHAT domain-containing protein [uncultured Aquimarina sp.]
MKKYILFLFYILAMNVHCQDISFALDSIHKSSGTDHDKLEIYYELLDSYKEQKNYTQLGYDAHLLAKWILREKDRPLAIKIVKMAYEAREKANPPDPELLKRSYYNYANYNKYSGNITEALEYFKKVIKVSKTDYLKGRANAIIGECYESLDDLYKSIEYQLKAFEYFKKNKNEKYIISNHISIAITYTKIRNEIGTKKAVQHLLIADSIIKNGKKPNVLKLYYIYNNLANLYQKGSGIIDVEKGFDYYTKALEIINNEKVMSEMQFIHYNIGISYIGIDSILSRQHLNQALLHTTKDDAYLANIYTGFGYNAKQNKEFLEAQEYFRKSFSLFFNTKIPDIYWLPKTEHISVLEDKAYFLELLKRKMHTWILMGKKENSLKYYQQAIRTAYTCNTLIDHILKENISQESKLLWRSLASEIYIIALYACNANNNLKDAFYFMEKSKVLLLMQDVSKTKINIPDSVLGREYFLKNKIINLQNELITTKENKKDSILSLVLDRKTKLQAYKDSLATYYPEYFTSTKLPAIISLEDVTLPNDEIVVQYSMAERVYGVAPETYGMLLSNDKKKLFKIDSLKKFEKNIYKLRQQLNKPFNTSKEIQEYKKLSNIVYESLFPKEIRSYIKNKKVTIIADHILNYFPFEALITDIEKNTYLIEETEINYEYSLSFKKQNNSFIRKPSKDFLGVAPVEFPDKLINLPKSLEEISYANSYYDGELLSLDKATKENFKKEIDKYKIVHLATHADASDSLNPWIAFRDKKLYHLELNTLKNNADLVVLSACNTSLGEVRRGEGIMSLARGFFKSGAKSVIPSLWSTNDKTTAIITSDFYKNLSEGQTKSAALRTAKLNYLHNNTDAEASPHYWASLVLIGDSGTLLPQYNNLLFLWIGLGVILVILLGYFVSKKLR